MSKNKNMFDIKVIIPNASKQAWLSIGIEVCASE